MLQRNRYLLHVLLFLWSLTGCQATLSPQASLPAETDIQINDRIPADNQAEEIIVPYRRQVTEKMNEVIGRATEELNGRTGKMETNLGNFVADLQRQQAAAQLGQTVDLGVITNGGLRAILPKGDIRVGDVFEVMPFENELLVLTLPGRTVQALFAYAAQRKNISISNSTFAIQDNQPRDIRIGDKPLDVNKTYTMAISDYLANGGDDLTFLKDAVKTEKTGLLLRDAIIQHIRQLTAQGKSVEAKIEGRVKIL